MRLRELYSTLEDKYYSVLESINAKIPILFVVEKIDKIIPSFMLLLIVIAILVIGIGLTLIGGDIPIIPIGPANVSIVIEDEFGNALSNANVELTYLGKKENIVTGENGKISLDIPMGSTIKIDVDKLNYERKTRTFEVTNKLLRFSVTLISTVKIESKRIQLLSSDGSLLLDQEVTVSFECSNKNVTPPNNQTVSSGVVEIQLDPNCGDLLVNATSLGLRTNGAQKPSPRKNEIFLQAYETPKGIVKVLVKDEDGKNVSGINVKLYNSLGVEISAETLYSGMVTFSDILTGEYYVSINDPNGKYALFSTIRKTVTKNNETTFNVTLSREIKGILTVKVIDKISQAEIQNATVKLFLKRDENPLITQITGTDGLVEFRLTDEDFYNIVVYREDYLLADANLDFSGDITFSVEIEKATPENSGGVLVKVRNEDGKPVEDSFVYVFNSKTNFVHPIDPILTNSIGEARIKGLSPGNYYFKAIKGLAEASSDAKQIELNKENKVNITLVRGKGLLKLDVIDTKGDGIPFANVELFIEGRKGQALTLTDNSGHLEIEIPGDSRFWIVVSKDSFANWVSISRHVKDKEVIETTAVLETTIPGREPKIELVGFYEDESMQNKVEVLDAKRTYLAKLIVKVPIDYDYNTLGIHLRTGDSKLLGKDNAFIKDVFGANAFVSRGTTYNPPKAYVTDAENITFGDSKWVELLFRGIKSGVYNIAAEVTVKPQVVSGDKIPFYYRVFGVTQDNEVLRDPYDAELSLSESVSTKDGFYAKANEKVFWEGEPELCDESFCYSGERIYDNYDKLFLLKPYSTEVFGKYQFQFDITNNSEVIHNNAEIRIKNASEGKIVDDILEIQSYKIVNANAQTFEAKETKIFELPRIKLGNFVKNRSIVGKIDFVPKKIGNTSFELQIVSDGKIVFSKVVLVTILSLKTILTEYEPKFIGAFVDTDFEITVIDELEVPIADALIEVTKRTENNFRKALAVKTNNNGKAKMVLPMASPNSAYIIEIKKRGYASEKITIKVSDQIVKFTPSELTSNLEVLSKNEEILKSQAENLIAHDIKIVRANVRGRFKGYLDNESMNGFLEGLNGKVLEGQTLTDLDIVKTILNPSSDISGQDTVNGKLYLYTRSDLLGKAWSFELPLTVNVGIGEGVSSDNCIIIEGDNVPNWNTISQGDPISIEFEIFNRCSANSRPVDLKNLKAEIIWNSNTIGEAELTISETDSGASYTDTLQQGEKVSYFETMKSDYHYMGQLTFIPKPDHFGEKADFSVKVFADVPTNDGLKLVNSNKEIKAKIDLIDFKECIKVTPDPDIGIEISDDEDEQTFELDTTECGNVKLDISLCHNDPNCKGGTEKGGIELTPREPVYGLKGTKQFKVRRLEVPGLYGITIHAKSPGKSYEYVKTMDVLVHPRTSDYFYLDRYEVSLLGKGSKDAITLSNKMAVENVAVTANLCDWGEASDDAMGETVLAGGLAAGIVPMAAQGIAYALAPITGLVFSPLGLIIIAVVAAIIAAVSIYLLLSENCKDDFKTETLLDWVINLKDDSRSLTSSDSLIATSWSGEITLSGDSKGSNGLIQKRGIIFENLGIENVSDTYSVVNIVTQEHVHGDPLHGSGKVTCKGSFGPYQIDAANCGPAEDTVYTLPIHMKFDTYAKEDDLPSLSADTFACVAGSLHGRTGDGAIPKIKLGWSWNSALPEGISITECDKVNSNYVYCDSTQFSIMLTKKMNALEKFLEVNNYDLGCPQDVGETYDKENNTSTYSEVAPSNFGVSGLVTEFATKENNLTVKTILTNNTLQQIDRDIEVTLYDFEDQEKIDTCLKGTSVSVDSNSQTECSFLNLPKGAYYIVSSVKEGADSENANSNQLVTSIIVNDEPNPTECWSPKTTFNMTGEPILKSFLEQKDVIAYPSDWESTVGPKSIDTVLNLINFDAYLIKDGYTRDFKKDFVTYYTIQNFSDTPNYFSGDSKEFRKYFLDDSKLDFSLRYVPGENTLGGPGLYNVSVNVLFGDEWGFFNSEGDPSSEIFVNFYKLKEPKPNSPFYSMPFDGLVGIQGTSFDRQGYGTEFSNRDDSILINDSLTQDNPRTYSDTGSNALLEVETEIEQDFRKINSALSTRGSLLTLGPGKSFNARKLVFSPNYATPLMIKVSHGLDNDSFQVRYAASVDEHAIDTGAVLSYWDGAGACRDFGGLPIRERFDYTPDRAGRDEDNFPGWQHSYVTQWPVAVEPKTGVGDVYLKTIFYSPRSLQSDLTIVPSGVTTTLRTPDSEGQSVPLDGISGMHWNNPGNSDFDKIDSLKDIFEMVSAREVCVTNTGLRTKYWWNPKSIYKHSGTQRNIYVDENTLVAGQTCIS